MFQIFDRNSLVWDQHLLNTIHNKRALNFFMPKGWRQFEPLISALSKFSKKIRQALELLGRYFLQTPHSFFILS